MVIYFRDHRRLQMKRETILKAFDWITQHLELNPNKTIRASRRDLGRQDSHYRWVEVMRVKQ